jgi:hypothetical protein
MKTVVAFGNAFGATKLVDLARPRWQQMTRHRGSNGVA